MAGEKWGQNNLFHLQVIDGVGEISTVKLSTRTLEGGVIALRASELWLALGGYSQDGNALVVLDSRLSPTVSEEEPKRFLSDRLGIALKPLIIINGVETRLPDKEHELLDVLTNYPNHYVEADELISAVWGAGYLLNEVRARNNLRKHINLIRGKLGFLEGLNPKSVIRSLRGHGYGFFDDSNF